MPKKLGRLLGRMRRGGRTWSAGCVVALAVSVGFAAGGAPALRAAESAAASTVVGPEAPSGSTATVTETEIASDSILTRALTSNPRAAFIFYLLVLLSVVAWAISIAKWVALIRFDRASTVFAKSFWESRSLNELNGRLGDFADSPLKEVFRGGYTELVRGTQLRELAVSSETALGGAMDNLSRSLGKARASQRTRLEHHLSTLAVIASVAPFVGLLGTVLGIMEAFRGIAMSGSASLAAVAPGISEALLTTAVGLAAAIPAVVGYNYLNARIRSIVTQIDGFCADFLNIVERYLVTGRSRKESHGDGTLSEPAT